MFNNILGNDRIKENLENSIKMEEKQWLLPFLTVYLQVYWLMFNSPMKT